MENNTKYASNGAIEMIRVRDFYANITRDIEIERSPNLFLPDDWTKGFAQGLKNVFKSIPGFYNSTVLEIGVGTGINMAGLLSLPCPPARFIGTDISQEAINASSALALRERWNVTLSQSDLLCNVSDDILANVDYIVGCIPQVPAPASINLMDIDNFAHYYESKGTHWDDIGLALNAALLQQAAERAPHAAIILNLSGRPGIKCLQRLFIENRYKKPFICNVTMVKQHHGTSLAAFAVMENNGRDAFEFFEDKDGKIPICASAAEQRRLDGKDVYHYVYVLIGVPLV
ncbi:unnamed protein product [Adineta steineri]|uniref:Uncharacterized protein n=1 Tax=Adineta steineri TaxID=433720 RepID=A0A814LVM4_9BILA|nr:unnamed protein product [Adineta steineri]CAF3973585.1 unnamed protein product [Adineta steineri]